jgi:hypothetical protein
MRPVIALWVVAAGCLVGCTTIEIHGSNRVDVVHQAGITWSLDVQASEPVLLERTSFGFDASSHDFVLGFRRSRSVYRPLSSTCQILIVVDRRSDADEAVNALSQSIRSAHGSVCVMRN